MVEKKQQSYRGVAPALGKAYTELFLQEINILYRGVAQLVARLLWEQDVGGSNPFTPTKKSQESAFLRLFFVYCTPIFANALPFFNRATTISGFEKLALFVIEC